MTLLAILIISLMSFSQPYSKPCSLIIITSVVTLIYDSNFFWQPLLMTVTRTITLILIMRTPCSHPDDALQQPLITATVIETVVSSCHPDLLQ